MQKQWARRPKTSQAMILLAAGSLSQAQPRSAAIYYYRGNERFKSGDLDGAIADYDAALIFEPRLAQAYNMRGTARYSKGDLDGSLAVYTRAIEIDPHLALAHYNRGKARRDKGDLDGSIVDYELAIRIDPFFCQGIWKPRIAFAESEAHSVPGTSRARFIPSRRLTGAERIRIDFSGWLSILSAPPKLKNGLNSHGPN
jgi:tetratricopeptide (TPR) repeat protein